MAFYRFTESINAFFSNTIILSALTAWFLAQLVKGIISLLNSGNRSLREVLEAIFWRTGGMPSSHASIVSSMATAVAFAEGVDSNLFAVTLFIALVIMRDAMGVRRSSGLQARALNILGKQIADHQETEFSPLKEIRGHHPLEVIVGALMGIFIACAFALL